MDDLLQPWRDEGRWDGEGSFTLDPSRALEKLGRYALEEPRRYILNLVSWAVAGGASGIDIVARAGRLELKVPGLIMRPDQLGELFSQVGFAEMHSRELAIATITASRLRRAEVLVNGPGSCLQVKDGKFRIYPSSDQAISWQLLEPKSLLGWAGRVLGSEHLEIPILRELCVHAEIPITVNGLSICRPYELPRVRKAIHLAGPTSLPLALEDLATGVIERRISPGPFSAIVVDSTTPVLETAALYLVRGVGFSMPPVDDLGKKFAVVVNAPSLLKDLSGKGLVENEDLRMIQETVADLAAELGNS